MLNQFSFFNTRNIFVLFLELPETVTTTASSINAVSNLNETKDLTLSKKPSGKVFDKKSIINFTPSSSSSSSNAATSSAAISSNNSSVYASYWVNSQSGTDRRGFGYSHIQYDDNEKPDSSIAQVKKGMIQFVKGEQESISATTAAVNFANQEVKHDTGKILLNML